MCSAITSTLTASNPIVSNANRMISKALSVAATDSGTTAQRLQKAQELA